MPQPYNPLDRVELGRSVERALLDRPLVPLEKVSKFPGAGLYVIYYVGDFPAYAPISPPAREPGDSPIYVGRARPKGARQGIIGLDISTSDPRLYERLREHVGSIRAVERYAAAEGQQNLRLTDFACRYLVADDVWVPLGEALLIAHYRPLWNVIVDGFGNHAVGGGRYEQARSPWDELHPGRQWAFRLPAPKHRRDEVLAQIRDHLASQPTPDLSSTPRLGRDVQLELSEDEE